MAESFVVGAYWGNRREDVESCANRLVGFLGALSEAHPLLAEWFRPGKTRVSAIGRPVEQTPDALRALLLAGRHHRDDDNSVMEELGFSARLWNAKRYGAALGVVCGTCSKWVSNAVSIELPEADGGALDLYRPQVSRAVMVALADYWAPDWATLVSPALRRLQQAPPRGPVIGWMTYLSSSREIDASRLPDGVITERLADGTMITIGLDVTSIREELVLAVRESLDDALLPAADV
jgi:hypothetical protein